MVLGNNIYDLLSSDDDDEHVFTQLPTVLVLQFSTAEYSILYCATVLILVRYAVCAACRAECRVILRKICNLGLPPTYTHFCRLHPGIHPPLSFAQPIFNATVSVVCELLCSTRSVPAVDCERGQRR